MERRTPSVARPPTARRMASSWPAAPTVIPTETETPTAMRVSRRPSTPDAAKTPRQALADSHASVLTATTAREASTA